MPRKNTKVNSASNRSANYQNKSHSDSVRSEYSASGSRKKRASENYLFNPTTIKLCLSQWNGQMLADCLLTRLSRNSEIKRIFNHVCFLFLTIQDFDNNNISTHLTRSKEEEDSFQNYCKEWEKNNTNLRLSHFFTKGLSNDVFQKPDGAKNNYSFLSKYAKKNGSLRSKIEEVDGAIWGYIEIGQKNRPQSGLCPDFPRYARFVGCKKEDKETYGYKDVEARDSDKRSKKYPKFIKTNYILLSNKNSIKTETPTHQNVAEYIKKFSEEVVFKSKFHDAYGNLCAVNYAIPIVFGKDYIGRIRLGFSKEPEPNDLTLLVNAVFSIVTELYKIAQERQRLIPEVFSPERSRVGREQFKSLQTIKEHLESDYGTTQIRIEAYKEYLCSILKDMRLNKYKKSLCFLQITIPKGAVGNIVNNDNDLTFNFWTQKADTGKATDKARIVDENIYSLPSKLSRRRRKFHRIFPSFGWKNSKARSIQEVINKLNDDKRTYLPLGSNSVFQNNLADYLGKNPKTGLSKSLLSELPPYHDLKQCIDKKIRVLELRTFRNIKEDFKKAFESKDKGIDLQIEVRDSDEPNNSRAYLIVIDDQKINDYSKATNNNNTRDMKSCAKLNSSEIEFYAEFDHSKIENRLSEYPPSLGIWSLFAAQRYLKKEYNLALTDISGRECVLAVCIPIKYGDLCYRMFAFFSATNENLMFAPQEDRIDKRYYDDLYDWFNDAVLRLEENRVFVSYEKMKREKQKLEYMKQVNFIDGHDAKNIMTELYSQISNANVSLLKIVCACVNRKVKDNEVCTELNRVKESVDHRPITPGDDDGLLEGFDKIQRALPKVEGIKNLPEFIKDLDENLVAFSWFAYDLNNNFRMRDVLRRAAEIKREQASGKIDDILGRVFCKVEYYEKEKNASIPKVIQKALSCYQYELKAREDLSPIQPEYDERVKKLIIPPKFHRKNKHDEDIFIRPGDWFYETVFQRIFHNIGSHGDGSNVKIKVEKLKEKLVVVISNEISNNDRIQTIEKWTKVDACDISPNYGGLCVIHDLFENTCTGEMFVKRSQNRFEVAFALNGLEEEK